MPTTSDFLAQQQETAAGGDAVAQSDTATVARSLLGDAAVEQFGDVIGARPAGIKDVLRDFTIGMSKGPGEVEKIKAMQLKAYNDALFKQQQTALARKKAEMEQVGVALDTYKKVQGMPVGARASLLKSSLEAIGVTPDPAALKLMLDGDVFSQVPFEDLMEANTRGELSVAELQAVFGSAKGALDFVSEMTRAQKDRQQINSIALDILRKREESTTRFSKMVEEQTGIPQNVSPDIAADPERARARELAARENGLASPEQPMFPQFLGVKTEKIRAVAKREALPPKKPTKKGTSGLGLLDQADAALNRGGALPTVNKITKVE
jgi:hypothetical protein